VHALANALVDRGHEVTVFSSCQATDGAKYATETIELSGSLRTFRFALRVRKLDLSAFDVLHAHGDDYWLWKRRTRAHVRTMHGSCFSEAIRIRGAWERLRMVGLGLGETLATFVADETACVSPGTRRWMPWVRTVIPAGVDTTVFRASDVEEPSPTILFVGTYRRRKRGQLLAEAFTNDVLTAMPDARLWMVCDDAPPGHGVEVLGRIDEETLADLYRRAWVFCLPSSYEGLGIPYIEAMASGLPVVATENPGARYVLDQGRCGVIVKPDELGQALLDVLSDAGRRSELRALGLERSAAFDLKLVVDRYLEIYDRLLARTP
jgi:glycosyltransferase involved in cell wall biosynthesis